MLSRVSRITMALVVLGAIMCGNVFAGSSGQSDDRLWWLPSFGGDVKIISTGDTFKPTFDSTVGNYGKYSWNQKFVGSVLTGDFEKISDIQYSITWNGKSQSFTSEADALQFLDEQFISLINGLGGASTAGKGDSPTGPIHLAANELAFNIFGGAGIKPRAQWEKGNKMNENPNVLLDKKPGAVPALAADAAPTASSGILGSTSNTRSALRYEHRWYDKSEAQFNRFGGTVRGALDWDKVSLDVMMPVDRVDFNQGFDSMDFTRIGLVIVPRLYLLQEADKNPVDLSVGFAGFYMHTFMDDNDVSDPDHAGIGPFIALQKTFSKAVVNAGFTWQRGFNLDGDREITGSSEVDVIKAALNVGVPIGDNWAVNLGALYSHTAELPGDFDADFVTGTLGATYILKDTWTLDFAIQRDFAYSDADNFTLHAGLGISF